MKAHPPSKSAGLVSKAANRPGEIKRETAPVARPAAMKALPGKTLLCYGPDHGFGSGEREPAALAASIALCLAGHSAFIRATVLAEIVVDDGDEWASARAGELAEVLCVADQAARMLRNGREWLDAEPFKVPGLRGEIKITPQRFLEQAAIGSHWVWHALANAALCSLDAMEAMELIEALVWLECIGDEWLTIGPDIEREGPTRLVLACGKARLAACLAYREDAA